MHTNHDYYSQHSLLDDHRPSLKKNKLINNLNHIIGTTSQIKYF